MEKQAKIICIGNQKGGTGKSTGVSIIANYLSKKTKFNILVVDADDLQQTLMKFREIDLQKGYSIDDLYHLVHISSNDFPKMSQGFIMDYDYIFIDLPGNLKQEGVISCYNLVDYLFIPTGTSIADIDSTIKFITLYNEKVVPIRNNFGAKTQIYSYLSRVKRNTNDYKAAKENRIFENIGIPMMEHDIAETVSLQSYATTAEVYSSVRNSNDYEAFCKEFLKIIKN